MILDQILEHKAAEVAARATSLPIDELRTRLRDVPAPLDFAGALRTRENGLPAVIAEVKKASPSKGVIREDFEPVTIAKAYESAGAAAVSVLTDEKFFQGSLEYLKAVKKAVSLPVLRKDFVIDEYQLYEARAAGADAVLLIVAALEKDPLARLMDRASELGMAALVEVHEEAEMAAALEVRASLIGINNRNLYTFEVSLETTERIMSIDEAGVSGIAYPGPSEGGRSQGGPSRKPKVVSESGIFTRADMERLGALGVDAVLIGEALMREDDIESKLRELIN